MRLRSDGGGGERMSETERDSRPHYTWRSTNTVSRILGASHRSIARLQWKSTARIFEIHIAWRSRSPPAFDGRRPREYYAAAVSLYPSKNRRRNVCFESRSIQQKQVCGPRVTLTKTPLANPRRKRRRTAARLESRQEAPSAVTQSKGKRRVTRLLFLPRCDLTRSIVIFIRGAGRRRNSTRETSLIRNGAGRKNLKTSGTSE